MAGSVNKDDLSKVYSEEHMARADIPTGQLGIGNKFLSKNGDVHTWLGDGWVQTSFGGAVGVSTDHAINTNAFKNYALTENLTPVAGFNVSSKAKLGLHISVEDSPLDQLEVHAQYSKDGDFISLGLVNADYSTPNHPVIRSNITDVAAITIGSYYLDIDVSAYYRIMIKAASSSASGSKVEIRAGDENKLPRRVTNAIGRAVNKVSTLTDTVAGDGAITVDDATGTFTASTAGAGGRALTQTGFNTVAGEYYAVSCNVVSFSGTLTYPTIRIAGGSPSVTADEGNLVNVGYPPVAGTRAMLIFRAGTTTTSAVVQFGIGTSASESAVISFVFNQLMIQPLGRDISNLGEWVPYGHTVLFNDTRKNYWEPSNRTFIEGDATAISCNPLYTGFIIGDSQVNNSDELTEQVQNLLGVTTHVYGVAGRTLETIAANIDSYFSGDYPVNYATIASDYEYSYAAGQKPYWCAIDAGINDIQGSGTTTTNINTMQSSFIAIHTKLKSLGIVPIALNTGPWAGWSAYAASNFDQYKTGEWNDWLRQYCAANDIPYIDTYTALEDKTNAYFLASTAATTGTHDGTGNSAILIDSTANFVPNALIGLTVTNTTDGSSGAITANTSTTVTATLSGGTDNDWDASDAYSIPSTDYDSNDGLHRNAAGNLFIADLVVQEIMKLA